MKIKIALATLMLLQQAGAETVTLIPQADAGLYQFAPDNNLGASTALQVGTNSRGTFGRALFRFPVHQEIPPGSRIDSVSVTFHVTATGSEDPQPHDLYRIQLAWGEGDGTGSQGTAAEAGQTTWNSRHHGVSEWTVPGGEAGSDFAASPGASASLGGLGPHQFASTPELVRDVQLWLDHPTENFGWALVSQDEGTASSTRRIATRENAGSEPRLVIEYTPFRITEIFRDMPTGDLELEWQGGTAPFQIERADTPSSGDWTMVGQSDSRSISLSAQPAQASYYRVVAAPPATTARYRVIWKSTWSSATHPTNFPGGAHYSALYGATHNDSVAFWEPGGLASTGIKNMAERGSNSVLRNEIQTAIGAGSAEHLLSGSGIGSPAQTDLEFEISQGHPLVSLVCMIAPSPDWFVGVHGFALFADGSWVDHTTVALQAYDAGTDSGTNYTSGNAITDPAQPITQIQPAGESRPFGTFTFERIE